MEDLVTIRKKLSISFSIDPFTQKIGIIDPIPKTYVSQFLNSICQFRIDSSFIRMNYDNG